MRWSNCAIEDLKKYEGMKSSLGNVAERISILNGNFIAIKGQRTDRTPTRGGGTHWEDFLLNNIVERERLSLLLESNHKLVTIMDRGLSALNKEEHRVLELFFIYKQRDHIERLCQELSLEKSQIYRIKEQALYKFTMYMYGIQEY